MNKQELKELVFQAYIEVLREQNQVLATGTEEILAKFPTLRKNLENLFTKEYNTFVKEVKYIAPKPTTFTVVLANDQEFYLKWMGKGFEAQIGGKKYYLERVHEFQQALDKLNELLRHAPVGGEQPEEESTEDMFGTETEPAGDLGGIETPAEEPEGGEEVEFEEEPTA
jgi:hypothetical protein